MAISYTETFDLSVGRADLALPLALSTRLDEALDGPHRHEVRSVIEATITRLIRHHGVDTETGEWLGDWSAADIVSICLSVESVQSPSIGLYMGRWLFRDLGDLFPMISHREELRAARDARSYSMDICLRAASAMAREIHGPRVDSSSNGGRLSLFPREIWEIFRDGVDDTVSVRLTPEYSARLLRALPPLERNGLKWVGDLTSFVCRDASADWDMTGGVDSGAIPRMRGVDFDAVEYRLSH